MNFSIFLKRSTFFTGAFFSDRCHRLCGFAFKRQVFLGWCDIVTKNIHCHAINWRRFFQKNEQKRKKKDETNASASKKNATNDATANDRDRNRLFCVYSNAIISGGSDKLVYGNDESCVQPHNWLILILFFPQISVHG